MLVFAGQLRKRIFDDVTGRFAIFIFTNPFDQEVFARNPNKVNNRTFSNLSRNNLLSQLQKATTK